MGYLSLYKTLSEHGADNSRLTPNISLITDENKLILTTKNNLNMIFNNINVVETTDEMTNNIILNKFPTDTSSKIPGIRIYTDNSVQSKGKNIKLYNNAKKWRYNYIIDEGLSDTDQRIPMTIDTLILDNKIIDEYNDNYNYCIYIYKDQFILEDLYWHSTVLTMDSDGSVSNVDLPTPPPDYTPTPDYTGTPDYTEMPDIDTTSTTSTFPVNIFLDPPYTSMPSVKIYTDDSDLSKANNIELYNNAQEYRDNFIIYNGESDTGQERFVYVDGLIIDDKTIDEYDGYYYNYGIDIYNDRITLIYINNRIEILGIYSDGSVRQINPIPSDSSTTTTTTTMIPTTTTTMIPTTTTTTITDPFPTDGSTQMSKLDIYADNSNQSKSKNIKLYNDAQEWRSGYILNKGLSDTGQGIGIGIDLLLIDGTTMNKFAEYYHYNIDIYNDHIILLNRYDDSEILTISSDGSVQFLFNKFPSTASEKIPSIKIYTDNSNQSKSNNIKLYNNAQEWRDNYISYYRLDDTGQGIKVFIDQLVIDDKIIDKYDQSGGYFVHIYNNRIILNSEVLTISSDGSVQFSFNKFPSTPFGVIQSIKIYTDNSDQSKSNNIELYNNAQEWRDNYISYYGSSDTGQKIGIGIDLLIIDDKIIDKYDQSSGYFVHIYNNRIILYGYRYSSEVLTISSDGSVSNIKWFG